MEGKRDIGPAARLVLMVFGILAILAAFPVAFFLLILLSAGDADLLGPANWREWLFRLALLGVPILLLLLGILSLGCTQRRDLRRLAYTALLIPACILMSYAAIAAPVAADMSERLMSAFDRQWVKYERSFLRVLIG
jgi:hypothetical protein